MITVEPGFHVWGGVLLAIALAIGVILIVGRSIHAHRTGKRSMGWGTVLVIGLAALIELKLWSAIAHENAAYHESNVNRDIARMDREDRHAESMHDLWQSLNKPRIEMEANEASASMEATVGEHTVKLESNSTIDAKPAAEERPAAKHAKDKVADSEPAGRDVNTEPASESEPGRGRGRPGSRETIETAGKDEDAIAAKRPAWVDNPPKRVGTVWREVVVAGEYATDEECYQAADNLLYVATWEHIQRLTNQPVSEPVDGDPSAKLVKAPVARASLQRMGVGIDTIRRQIVPEDGEYLETVERSFGPMKRLYTQMEFTPSVDRELEAHWQAYQREERLTAVAGVGGLAVGVVGLAYSLLKVDTWTKGYYTKRLFLGVPAAIIGLIALAAAVIGP